MTIEPRGITFTTPATLRSANTWGFDPGTRIPTAFWDPDSNRWVPDGSHLTVTSDGAWIEKQLSAIDLPASARGRSRLGGNAAAKDQDPQRASVGLDGNIFDAGGGNAGNHSPGCKGPNCNTACMRGSSVGVPNAVFKKSISLPAVTSLGSNAALSFD